MAPGTHLRVEVEPLQRVDHQRVLGQLVVHYGVHAVQEGRRLDHRLVVGVVEALRRSLSSAASMRGKQTSSLFYLINLCFCLTVSLL